MTGERLCLDRRPAQTGPAPRLPDSARALGFCPVERYAGIDATPQRQVDATPLMFFLCARCTTSRR